MIPQVSVLLPYRNAAATLAEALGSILGQQGPTFEVLAVDDGSTDGGPEMVARAAARDPRLIPLTTAAGHGGIVAALTVAARHARAPLLARMDADDVSLAGRFARQVAMFERNPSVAAVGTRVEAFSTDAVGEGLRRYVAWQNALVTHADHVRDLFVESPLCHPSVMLRRAAFDEVGGYRETDWWEDYDLWLRLWAAGHRFEKVPEVLLRWRHTTGRMTLVHPRAAPERTRQAKAAYLTPWLRARGRPITVWGAGPTGRRLARALEAHGVRAHRFVDIDPRKLGRRARGAPIVDPQALRRGEETVVVAVGSLGARDLVRAHLDDAGFRELDDYLCAA